jgi:hypothetical protein
MKKVIFSAIAMIAFVGTSMANASEIKKSEVFLVVKTCEEKAMDYLDARDPNNVLTSTQAHEIYTAFLSGCANTNKSVPLQP